MTSGISTISIATASLLLTSLVFAIPSRAAPESALDAKSLVANLKRDAPARTRFTEVRFSNVLERPLILHGELEYDGPGKLSRDVEQPYREQMTLANGEASVQRGDHPARTFSLSQAPELEGFLRGFTALLGGDADSLARDFELAPSGDAQSWHLKLSPRDERLRKRVTAIEVDGSEKSARCFRTAEADGDVSVLLVESLADAKLPTRPTPPQIYALCRGAAPR